MQRDHEVFALAPIGAAVDNRFDGSCWTVELDQLRMRPTVVDAKIVPATQ